MAVYLIDGVDVNDRIDWTSSLVPGAMSALTERYFPGDARRYLLKGQRRPSGITIEGFLQASSHLQVYNQAKVLGDYMDDTQLHSVTFQSITFADVDMVAFSALGNPQGIGSNDLGYTLRLRVRMTWMGAI